MIRSVCLILAVSLLIAADKKDSAKNDKDKLQGTWSMVSGESNGDPPPDEMIKNFRMVFNGDRMTLKFGPDKGQKEGTFKLDPRKKPKEILLTPSKEGEKPMQGIYDLDGDNLKLCMARAGNPRPKEFAAKKGSTDILMVLRRAKP
jgi:uncharacterized protein (TIGR03067 family)